MIRLLAAARIALAAALAAPAYASTSLPETRERNAPLIMENADRFEGNRSRGEYVLSGKVRFRHGQMLMETERAVWMKDRNIVFCESGMRITRNGSLLTADRGTYDKNMGQATAEGNVFMRDSSGENTATGQSVVYLRFRHLATLTGNPEVRRFYVKKDSAAKDSASAKTGNAAAAVRDSAVAKAAKNSAKDSAASRPVKAGSRLRTAKAKAGAEGSDGPDTLSIKGDLMTYNDSLQVAVADGNVRIHRDKMNITCKKAEYHDASDSLYLLGEPVVVVDDNQVKGEVMRLGMHGEEIKSLLVKGSAQAHSTEPATDSSAARQSDVKGDSLFLAFKEKAIDSVQVFKNANGAYFDVDKPEFVNKMSGDYMVLRFNGKQVASANVTGGNAGAKSTYYHFEKKRLKGKNDAEGDTIDFAFKDGKIDEVMVKGSAKGTYFGEKQRKGGPEGPATADSAGAPGAAGTPDPAPAKAEAGKNVPPGAEVKAADPAVKAPDAGEPGKTKREKPAPNIPWRVK
jgi:lipopolysaccharide export system protein LptA